jgi:cytochrome c556
MRLSSLKLSALILAAATAAVALPAFLRADASPAPVAEVKDLMNAFNHKSYGMFGLIKATTKGEPTAADWKVAAYRAVAVAECGNLLMGLTPPRGAEDEAGKAKWAAHCASFRDAAKEVAKQIKMKKLAECQAALAELEKRCDACHADHQLE